MLGAWCCGSDRNKMLSFVVQLSYQKNMGGNFLPKVGENERDELYKAMCMLIDAESEIKFE